MRPVTLLKSIVLSAALSSAGMVPGVVAATTTVVWSGGDNFNDAQITFDKFKANELIDITGFGQYEACCTVPAVTSFNLDLRLNGHWTTVFSWTTTGDEIQHKLGDLVPPVIKFSTDPIYVSGIKLTSSPDGKPSNDYNFTDFDFVTYLSRDQYYELHKSEYKSREDFDGCGDYERYVHNVTSFIFCSSCFDGQGNVPISTPLPAALPLMGSVLGGFGFAMWRRRRKRIS
jgi:hypothetical protein